MLGLRTLLRHKAKHVSGIRRGVIDRHSAYLVTKFGVRKGCECLLNCCVDSLAGRDVAEIGADVGAVTNNELKCCMKYSPIHDK